MELELSGQDRPRVDPVDEVAFMRLADDGCPLFPGDLAGDEDERISSPPPPGANQPVRSDSAGCPWPDHSGPCPGPDHWACALMGGNCERMESDAASEAQPVSIEEPTPELILPCAQSELCVSGLLDDILSAAVPSAVAWATVLARLAPQLVGLLRRQGVNTADAEDIVNLALFKLHCACACDHAFRPGAYLWAVLASERANLLRKKEREERNLGRRVPFEAVTVPVLPFAKTEADLDRAALLAIIREAIARLPRKLREVAVCCFLDGHTYEVAAEQFGVSTGTISRRLAEARRQLRLALARAAGDLP